MRFLVVYIAEAHASDEWPVGALTSVTTQPKTLAHRLALAHTVHTQLLGQPAPRDNYNTEEEEQAQDEELLPVVCDNMSNSFERTMAAWPIRMYVLDPRTGEMLYKAQPDLSPEIYGYSLERLEEWLEGHVGGAAAADRSRTNDDDDDDENPAVTATMTLVG